ncbi:YciI family protein [Actinoplanes sp. NPDC004185]
MAKYLVLIYGDEQEWANTGPQERARIEAGHQRFAAAAGAAVLGGQELMPPGTATSLRQGAAERPTVTDGPFLESKEVLGGFYVLEAADLDAAIALAGLLPEVSASHSGVEIRPIREHN